ncbi:hypothetical protein Q7C36_016359 [Tachysurus vachellii]|uniref:Uncharacterized protein n=1 Tax=Tachysurus vachellii TaxID=175792 RepID=A0AA88M971_TACVA|nr:hypothetical protein Q7C36_016359 [Tachysurus vachellii]
MLQLEHHGKPSEDFCYVDFSDTCRLNSGREEETMCEGGALFYRDDEKGQQMEHLHAPGSCLENDRRRKSELENSY